LLLLCVVALPPAPAAETAAPALRTPLSATTEHRGRFNDQAIRYRAVVAETFVPNADGAPAGAVVTISYLKRGVAEPASRPVMFLFNGGPGASTTPLHFDAFGPRRRLGEDDNQWMTENTDSPLDATDLVFIDPVGTGYSRPLPGADGAQFWTRTMDAKSVAFAIREWLRRHGREASPRYLAGQSYGTVRAATMLAEDAELAFDGVLLFALVGGAEGHEMPLVVTLPTMAAIAWYHDRIERNGSVQQVFDEAVAFARGEYVTALIQGGSLPAEELQAVAARMSAFTGLPADFLIERQLRLSKEDFYLNLLKDQGLRTGQLDGRATARLDAPAQRPPYDDPGISYTPDPPPPAPEEARARDAGDEPSALERYFRQDLRFESPERYVALNLDVNQAWKPEGAWGEGPAFQSTETLAAAMQARPRLRLFWVAGLYDLSTPAYAGRYALDRAGVPADRLTAVRLPGGHSVYKDEANRKALSDAVRRFVSGAQ
jgi:carboxypeptidase C (cathepsin A)